jgi:hypothetical protein
MSVLLSYLVYFVVIAVPAGFFGMGVISLLGWLQRRFQPVLTPIEASVLHTDKGEEITISGAMHMNPEVVRRVLAHLRAAEREIQEAVMTTTHHD